jgi:hypothetical protein
VKREVRAMLQLAIAAAVAYAAVLLLVFVFQSRLIYFPVNHLIL